MVMVVDCRITADCNKKALLDQYVSIVWYDADSHVHV